MVYGILFKCHIVLANPVLSQCIFIMIYLPYICIFSEALANKELDIVKQNAQTLKVIGNIQAEQQTDSALNRWVISTKYECQLK